MQRRRVLRATAMGAGAAAFGPVPRARGLTLGGPFATGAVVALQDAPDLWVAGDDGKLHWAGDTRSLSNKRVDWSNRTEITFDQLYAFYDGGLIGDPWLSAGLVKIGNPIFFVKWEADQQPELFYISSIDSLRYMGVGPDNYGQLVLDRAAWEARYGLDTSTLVTHFFSDSGYYRQAEKYGWRLTLSGIYRGFQLPKPYDSWTSLDTELVVLRLKVENVSASETTFARRDFDIMYDEKGGSSRTPTGVRDKLSFQLPWRWEEFPNGGAPGDFPPGKSRTGVITFPGQSQLNPYLLSFNINMPQKYILMRIDRFPISRLPQ